MKNYIKPEVEIMEMTAVDVICASGEAMEEPSRLNTKGIFSGSKSYNSL